MDKIIYSLVYNRKKSLNKKGMALVQVEAYLNRKKKYFSTKVYLSPDQWDFKKRMVKNHPNADAINHMLYEFMAEIEKKELGLWQQGKQISLDSLKNSMENQDDRQHFIYCIFPQRNSKIFIEGKYKTQSSLNIRIIKEL